MTIAYVVALEHPKHPGEETLVVNVPTEEFECIWRAPDGTTSIGYKSKHFKTGSKIIGSQTMYKTRKTIFPYPERATVVPDRDVVWWNEKFKIGQIEYRKSTGKYSSEIVFSIEDIIQNGVAD